MRGIIPGLFVLSLCTYCDKLETEGVVEDDKSRVGSHHYRLKRLHLSFTIKNA